MNEETKQAYKNFGKVIKKKRYDAGLTLKDVAEIIGIPIATLYEYEQHGVAIPLHTATKLSTVLRFDVFGLFPFSLNESAKHRMFLKKQKLHRKKFRSKSSEEMIKLEENLGIISKRNFEDSGHSICV